MNTSASIDVRVEKLLKDLGNPKPPLNLDEVRRLLKLDLGYYSTENTSWLKEKVHQMKVAGKQVISEPTAMLKVVKSLSLKGILLVDRRQVLLDNDVPEPKLRWNQAHEISHDILPWHQEVAHGDPAHTLVPSCSEIIEAEANYGAGRLLFCGQAFPQHVRSSKLDFSLVQALRTSYGNTMTTTLWRTIEATQTIAFGLVSVHPSKVTGDVNADVRYFIRSPRFALEFSAVDYASLFVQVCRCCRGTRGPIGEGICTAKNGNGAMRVFAFETFYNGYDALTIAVAE